VLLKPIAVVVRHVRLLTSFLEELREGIRAPAEALMETEV
jgi:hypothetical protein